MNQYSLLAILLVSATTVLAEVKLPAVFSDHMVLQRDLPVPIWGTAAPGEKITIKFAGQEKSAVADAAGNWRLKLDPLKASAEPRALVVSSSINHQPLTISSVLVGDVWVGSGQSNMAGSAGGYSKNDPVLAAAIAAAPYPQIRLLKGNGRWAEATAQNISGFSALLFAFGARLHQELGVPVGLMVGAVGGTPSGYWLSEEALKNDAPCQDLIKKYAATFNYDEALKKYEKEAALGKEQKKTGPRPPSKPGETSGGKVGHLYEKHIRPMIPYGIRGVLWDQGESGTALAGVDQYTLMGALIRGWRKEWGQGDPSTSSGRDFPFLYIQKPSGGGGAWDPANPMTNKAEPFAPLPDKMPGDGGYVETHIKIMQYPNTAMAISSDLGPGVHPTNKSGYGHRAAAVALGMVYGRKIEYYGPLYASHTIEAGKVRLKFTHVGQGLAFRHADKLQGFAIAGEDKQFHWADAAIAGDTVILSSSKVPKPVAVRYAWATKRPWANLFNKDGLPAVPFRTDQW